MSNQPQSRGAVIFCTIMSPSYQSPVITPMRAVLATLFHMSDSQLKYYESIVEKTAGYNEAVAVILEQCQQKFPDMTLQEVDDAILVIYNDFCDFHILFAHARDFKQELQASKNSSMFTA